MASYRGNKKISEVYEVSKKISASEILSINTNPVEIIPAPGVGKYLMVHSVLAYYKFGTTAYDTNTTLALIYEGAEGSTDRIKSWYLGAGESFNNYDHGAWAKSGSIEDKAVNIYVENGDPLNGDGILEIYVTYSVHELLPDPGDTTPPELLEPSIGNETPSELALLMSESVTLTVEGWSVSTDAATGINITGITGSGNNNPTLVLDRQIESTETLTVSYDDTGLTDAEKTKDLSGNFLANITNEPVVNNVLPKLDTPTISRTNRTTSSITVGWTNVSNESGYRLQISDDGGSTWATEVDLGVDVISYQQTGLNPGETRHYRVRALGDNVSFIDSNWSNALEATTNPQQLNTPTGFDAITGGSDVIDLFWNDNNTNETGYELQISTDGGATYNPLTTLPENTTSHQDTGLSGGIQYFYRLRATGDGVSYTNSNWTVASATTDAATTSSSVGEGAVGEATIQ